MLNEERIKLMTRMASYEETEGRKNMAVGSYFRGDYISMQVIKSIISATLAFIIGLGMLVFYDFELVMKEIYQVDLLKLGKNILIAYVVFAGIYAVISYVVFSYRYNQARKSLKSYYAHLRELSELHEEERKK